MGLSILASRKIATNDVETSNLEFPQARLLVFAKAPVPGRVKTRLARRYGKLGAATLYQQLLHRNLKLLHRAKLCPIQLWCAPNARHGFFVTCRRNYKVDLRIQKGHDLGERMNHALTQTLKTSRYALVIGGDCVSLSHADLCLALQTLEAGHDAVLGPAEDGGYVLLGLRRPCSGLFKGISWGSHRVLAATRRRLQKAGLNWTELPPRWDVDRPEDVRRMKRWEG